MNSASHVDDNEAWARVDAETTPLERDVENPSEPSWLRESPQQPKPTTNPPKSAKKLQYKRPEKRALVMEPEEDCCCVPKDPIQYFFYLYHMVACVLGVLNLCCNAGLIVSRKLDPRDFILHGYGFLFSAIVVAVEIDFRPIVSRVRLLDLWLFRGLFYAYVGFVTFNSFVPGKSMIAVTIVGILLMFVGIGYSIMGMCCIRTRLRQASPSLASAPTDRDPWEDYIEIPSDFQATPSKE